VTVIAVLICCGKPNWNKIGSRVRPPDPHNCWMFNAPLLGNGRCHGNRIIGNMMGPPTFHSNRSINRRVIAFPTFCNMAAVRHFEYQFCYSGPPTKSAMRFDYPVKIWYRSDIHRRRYYNFIILPVWRGAFSQICKILRFCDFFVVLSCAVLVMLFFRNSAQVEPLDGF